MGARDQEFAAEKRDCRLTTPFFVPESPRVEDLGLISYQEAYTRQKSCVEEVQQGASDRLFLCEHPPVLTLGRLASRNHILISQDILVERGIPVYDIDRGGEVTLHAPGQLVLYPVLNLKSFKKDLKFYLHHLEQVAIDFLEDFGILASRISGRTGVWVSPAGEAKKIASIGIGVRKWVTFHGLAMNINTDLSLYSMIRPCGLDVAMTSVKACLGRPVDLNAAKVRLVEKFVKCFYSGTEAA